MVTSIYAHTTWSNTYSPFQIQGRRKLGVGIGDFRDSLQTLIKR